MQPQTIPKKKTGSGIFEKTTVEWIKERLIIEQSSYNENMAHDTLFHEGSSCCHSFFNVSKISYVLTRKNANFE